MYVKYFQIAAFFPGLSIFSPRSQSSSISVRFIREERERERGRLKPPPSPSLLSLLSLFPCSPLGPLECTDGGRRPTEDYMRGREDGSAASPCLSREEREREKGWGGGPCIFALARLSEKDERKKGHSYRGNAAALLGKPGVKVPLRSVYRRPLCARQYVRTYGTCGVNTPRKA